MPQCVLHECSISMADDRQWIETDTINQLTVHYEVVKATKLFTI